MRERESLERERALTEEITKGEILVGNPFVVINFGVLKSIEPTQRVAHCVVFVAFNNIMNTHHHQYNHEELEPYPIFIVLHLSHLPLQYNHTQQSVYCVFPACFLSIYI